MRADNKFRTATLCRSGPPPDSTIGEGKVRKGHVVTSIDKAISVDFVTKTGRGGLRSLN